MTEPEDYNGEGSFRVNGTNNRYDNIDDSLQNPAELANASDAPETHDVRKVVSERQDRKFDDIVVWDSQITLYKSLRNGTCESAQSI